MVVEEVRKSSSVASDLECSRGSRILGNVYVIANKQRCKNCGKVR